jgi:hypothetical protein
MEKTLEKRAKEIAERVLPPSNWPGGDWTNRRKVLAKELLFAFKEIQDETISSLRLSVPR